MESLKFLSQGETGLVVEFGSAIDPVVNTCVHALARRVGVECGAVVEAVIPTYRSFLIFFDPLLVSRQALIEKIKELAAAPADSSAAAATKTVLIPTLYGGEAGPDLEFVAGHNQLTPAEVVRIHSSVPYRIYMIGFTPGFPYLGGMSEKIAAPRLKTPRTKIPAGSVGIAGTQTGLYPVESPGGWQLIGRTPLKVFNPRSEQPFLYSAGDFLQFQPVTADEYEQISRDVDRGVYQPQSFVNKEAAI